MAMNVTIAVFEPDGDKIVMTDPIWQYDYGQIQKFSGIEQPEIYEVHFGTSFNSKETVTQLGDENGVEIPDELLTTGNYIYAYIFLHEGDNDGETEYAVTIPVRQRPKPSDTEPTPVQQDIISQTIAALNQAVAETSHDVEMAQAAATLAEKYAGGTAIPFDPEAEDVTIGQYISGYNTVGTQQYTERWTTNASMMESGYISINKGDLIEIIHNGNYVNGAFIPLYDANKNFIAFSGESGSKNCYYINADAAYCRIPMVEADKYTYILRRRTYPDLPTILSGRYVLTLTMNGRLEPVFNWVSTNAL